ncbi:MAG: PH domain-containing protein [Bacteroidetes bacterium]|nr:PH domain-containing protein [Bacteroidota bacterium]
MLFENNTIDIKQLPTQEKLVFEPLKPAYKTILFVNWTVFFIIISLLPFTIDALFEIHLLSWWLIIFYVIILSSYICMLIITQMGFPLKGYALREHDIVYKTGLIYRKNTTVPFNRIQHIEIRQSMIARILGISKIKIFTAGGQGSGLFVHGLSPETAQELKDFLSKTTNQYE